MQRLVELSSSSIWDLHLQGLDNAKMSAAGAFAPKDPHLEVPVQHSLVAGGRTLSQVPEVGEGDLHAPKANFNSRLT